MPADASDIIVVSGLPRSGTSLMMQMLSRGGIEIQTDGRREPDIDNPRGYFEFEPVKALKQGSEWLAPLRGKALKVVSQLLYELPDSETFRIIFMERNLDEVVMSQEQMLMRLGQPVPSPNVVKHAYEIHLAELQRWLAEQSHLKILVVRHSELLAAPFQEVQRIQQFLGVSLRLEEMLDVIDPRLYRNRAPG